MAWVGWAGWAVAHRACQRLVLPWGSTRRSGRAVVWQGISRFAIPVAPLDCGMLSARAASDRKGPGWIPDPHASWACKSSWRCWPPTRCWRCGHSTASMTRAPSCCSRPRTGPRTWRVRWTGHQQHHRPDRPGAAGDGRRTGPAAGPDRRFRCVQRRSPAEALRVGRSSRRCGTGAAPVWAWPSPAAWPC